MNEIKIFSPATVANVACGFDVLGFALKEVGDTMYVRKSDKRGINITQIERFLAFLLISGNLLLVSLLKTKNHKFGIGPWKNSLKKEKT